MAFSIGQIDAIVKQYIDSRLVDQVYSDMPLMYILKDKGKVGKYGRGTIQFPIIKSKGTNIVSYNEFDLLPTTPANSITAGSLTMGHYAGQLTLGVQTLANAMADGKDAVINLLDAEQENTKLGLVDTMATDLYTNSSETNNKIVGMAGIISTTSTYANLAVADLADWKAKINSTDIALSAMELTDFKKQIQDQTIGTDYPDLAVTTQAVWNKIWALVVANERYVNPNTLSVKVGAWEGIQIGQTTVIWDQHIPTGLFVANRDPFIVLNTKYLQVYVQSGYNIDSEQIATPINQDIRAWRCRWFGQLVCSKRRAQGAITSIDPAA